MPHDFASDLAAVARIDAVKTILEVICRTTGMGFSAVARVTDTHWIACAVRDEINFCLVPGGELELRTTICDQIRDTGEIVAIDDVANDAIYCNHQTPAIYGFRSYLSVPIRLPDGRFFGTLCAIDPKPVKVSGPETVGMFKLFADLIGQHLDTHERMAMSERALLDARETSKLREQFIAVLGHDLRNPLAAIESAASVLKMTPQEDPEAIEFIDMISRSTGRMAELIDNLMDFARGRLGGGLTVNVAPDPKLAGTLREVIDELQTAWPKRQIDQHIAIDRIVSCDGRRIGQLLSNILGNALTHGAARSPIQVTAQTSANGFELSVSNQGSTIPPEIMTRLFEPFSRGNAAAGEKGLGLGLYISAEIARAHGGTLEVASSAGLTTFTLKVPVTSAKSARMPM